MIIFLDFPVECFNSLTRKRQRLSTSYLESDVERKSSRLSGLSLNNSITEISTDNDYDDWSDGECIDQNNSEIIDINNNTTKSPTIIIPQDRNRYIQ